MTTRDVGDRMNLQHLVYNSSGALTNATVVLTVTDPAGSISTPAVSNTATGTYTAGFTLSSAGTWSWVWTVSGTVVDVDYGSVLAVTQAPQTYASLPELKAYMGITDTTEDALLSSALDSASRGISQTCQRTFGTTTTAAARVFEPNHPCWAVVDDFWSTDSLAIAVDSDGNGTFETTWTSSDYELEPFSGIVNGEPGWPYSKIRAINRYFPSCTRRRGVLQVTAKWGWASVPEPVKQACLMLASETFRLKGAPFGVANTDQFGPVRVRDNPMAMRRLQPYIRYPVLVA